MRNFKAKMRNLAIYHLAGYNIPMAKHPGGRPTKYNPSYHPAMAKLAAEGGRNDDEIANELRISTATLNNWKIKYPEFLECLRAGKKSVDDEVESALLKKALGFRENAVKIFMPSGAPEPIYAPFEEYYPPDTTAGIFWLKNRQPERWREKVEQVHSGGIEISNLTPEERRARIEQLNAKRS